MDAAYEKVEEVQTCIRQVHTAQSVATRLLTLRCNAELASIYAARDATIAKALQGDTGKVAAFWAAAITAHPDIQANLLGAHDAEILTKYMTNFKVAFLPNGARVEMSFDATRNPYFEEGVLWFEHLLVSAAAEGATDDEQRQIVAEITKMGAADLARLVAGAGAKNGTEGAFNPLLTLGLVAEIRTSGLTWKEGMAPVPVADQATAGARRPRDEATADAPEAGSTAAANGESIFSLFSAVPPRPTAAQAAEDEEAEEAEEGEETEEAEESDGDDEEAYDDLVDERVEVMRCLVDEVYRAPVVKTA
jgi:hypothetical protein